MSILSKILSYFGFNKKSNQQDSIIPESNLNLDLVNYYTQLGITIPIHVTESPTCAWSTTRKCLVGAKNQLPLEELSTINNHLSVNTDNIKILTLFTVKLPLDAETLNIINSKSGIIVMNTRKDYLRFCYVPE